MENTSGANAAVNTNLVMDSTDASFSQDVMESSLSQPVIVDFWAPWCGPCRQLGPALEAAVQAAGGAVRMVKINIDENPSIAQQLQVQSIPAVFAFAGGQPVDGFMGAKPESEINEFVEKLVAMAENLGGAEVADPVEAAMTQANEIFEQGDVNGAADIYSQVLEHVTGHVGAAAGLALCYLQMGSVEGAEGLLDTLPEESLNDPVFEKVKAAIAKAHEAAAAAGEIDKLKAAVADNPNDHQARFDLAVATFAVGESEAAMDLLLEIFAKERDWNENAARLQLLKMFEEIGHADPIVIKGRRRLSSMMFS